MALAPSVASPQTRLLLLFRPLPLAAGLHGQRTPDPFVRRLVAEIADLLREKVLCQIGVEEESRVEPLYRSRGPIYERDPLTARHLYPKIAMGRFLRKDSIPSAVPLSRPRCRCGR